MFTMASRGVIRTAAQFAKLEGSVFIFKLSGNEGLVLITNAAGESEYRDISWSLVQRMRADFTVLPIVCYVNNQQKKEVAPPK